MDPLVAIIGTLLLLFIVPLLLLHRRKPAASQELVLQDGGVPTPVIRQAGTRRMRHRTVFAASSSSAEPLELAEEEEPDESTYYAAKISKKKEIKKQEKEARRQAEETSRDMRRQKQDNYAEMRRRKDEERETEEHRKEEEARVQKAKEEAAANAEFEKWKDAFTVDTEGTLEQELQEESQFLLNNFVGYIKCIQKHKCVGLEDLAAEFHLHTQDAIDRILSLERIGRLSGVMDDRGKYIYISLEEMKAVADYMKREGRVSISHLARKSNEFIDLEPKSFQEDAGINDMNAIFQGDKIAHSGGVIPIATMW